MDRGQTVSEYKPYPPCSALKKGVSKNKFQALLKLIGSCLGLFPLLVTSPIIPTLAFIAMTSIPALIIEITKAFDDVALEDGVGLHQAIAIDDWEPEDKVAAAATKDERFNWQKLFDDPDFIGQNYVLTYADCKGVRFALPAIMITILKDLSSPVSMSMTSLIKERDKRLDCLNANQLVSFKKFVRYYLEHEEGDWCDRRWYKQAIHWCNLDG